MSNLMIKPFIFDEAVSLREAVNSLFDSSFLTPSWNGTFNVQKQPFAPLNVYEDNNYYYIVGLFPGMAADKFDLSVKEEVMTIRGQYMLTEWLQSQVQTINESSNGNKQGEHKLRPLLTEIPQGQFYRQIQLPAAFEADKIEAYYEQGVLKLLVPKSARSQVRRIPVQPIAHQFEGNTNGNTEPQLVGNPT